VAKKTAACLKASLHPVVCIGETQQERDDGLTATIIERQVTAVIDKIGDLKKDNLILAYEPVWAIGTGKTATAAQVEEAHGNVRRLLHETVGKGLAEQIPILYGGSVTAQNIAEIGTIEEVDGALVGTASLQAESFCLWSKRSVLLGSTELD
jgi:triosephosphate isomerase